MTILFNFLGLITSLVIVLSKMCNVNPDNVATPIAGALGDITALVILSFTATMFYNILSKLLNFIFFVNNSDILISECCVVVSCDLRRVRVPATVFLLGGSPQQIHQRRALPRLDARHHRYGYPSVSLTANSDLKGSNSS
jgi:hypothetical protein